MSRFKYAKPADEAGQNEAKRLAMIRKAQGDVIWCVCVCVRVRVLSHTSRYLLHVGSMDPAT